MLSSLTSNLKNQNLAQTYSMDVLNGSSPLPLPRKHRSTTASLTLAMQHSDLKPRLLHPKMQGQMGPKRWVQ